MNNIHDESWWPSRYGKDDQAGSLNMGQSMIWVVCCMRMCLGLKGVLAANFD